MLKMQHAEDVLLKFDMPEIVNGPVIFLYAMLKISVLEIMLHCYIPYVFDFNY